MKIGVLGFSYAGSAGFARHIEQSGFYTVNLGDNAQTIAARQLLLSLGVAADDIIDVDRDTLPDYAGEPVALIMNGVFLERSFPIPDSIHPIFIGFCAKNEAVVRDNRDYLKRHEPIGCRDLHTVALMHAHGIVAFATGCVTMTLPPRTAKPKHGKLLIVYGAGAGTLLPQVLKYIPPALLDRARFIAHRLPVHDLPLSPDSRRWIDDYETSLLGHYRDTADLVLTPLLHVASPCLGMRIPVVLYRKDLDTRFTYLAEKLPIHTPETVADIDWAPGIVDVGADADLIRQALASALGAIAGPV
jgi:hypothetical protein